jgi:hypothetical protein
MNENKNNHPSICSKWKRLLFCIPLYAFLMHGCAFDIAHVRHQPVQLITQQDISKFIILNDDVLITDAGCYQRKLLKGTKWQMIGSVSDGMVYKSSDQVLTLECANVHEAYPVVLENRLVGFYLPFEKGLVKLSNPILLP